MQATLWRPLSRSGGGNSFRCAIAGAPLEGALADAAPATPSGVWRGPLSGAVYRARAPGASKSLVGVTRRSDGTVLAGCIVKLYVTSTNMVADTTVSDAAGNFSFNGPGTGPFYLRAYLAGSPDVAGVSVNTLLPG